MRDGPFGPLVPLCRVRRVDVAIEMANADSYGPTAYAFAPHAQCDWVA